MAECLQLPHRHALVAQRADHVVEEEEVACPHAYGLEDLLAVGTDHANGAVGARAPHVAPRLHHAGHHTALHFNGVLYALALQAHKEDFLVCRDPHKPPSNNRRVHAAGADLSDLFPIVREQHQAVLRAHPDLTGCLVVAEGGDAALLQVLGAFPVEAFCVVYVETATPIACPELVDAWQDQHGADRFVVSDIFFLDEKALGPKVQGRRRSEYFVVLLDEEDGNVVDGVEAGQSDARIALLPEQVGAHHKPQVLVPHLVVLRVDADLVQKVKYDVKNVVVCRRELRQCSLEGVGVRGLGRLDEGVVQLEREERLGELAQEVLDDVCHAVGVRVVEGGRLAVGQLLLVVLDLRGRASQPEDALPVKAALQQLCARLQEEERHLQLGVHRPHEHHLL
mmetsp:Transcript_13836/g.35302  ORF Transcript_13836/g.35302 Transcript_13836/m.35302 type:complete len:395 (+) Transcript_13836:361-1545(+)